MAFISNTCIFVNVGYIYYNLVEAFRNSFFKRNKLKSPGYTGNIFLLMATAITMQSSGVKQKLTTVNYVAHIYWVRLE